MCQSANEPSAVLSKDELSSGESQSVTADCSNVWIKTMKKTVTHDFSFADRATLVKHKFLFKVDMKGSDVWKFFLCDSGGRLKEDKVSYALMFP